MSLFLLSFAGIPLTAGFIGKLSVFTAAMESGFGALVVLAMVATAVTAFFYLRIVVVMYFSEPVGAGVRRGGVGRRGRLWTSGWRRRAGSRRPMAVGRPRRPYVVVPGVLTVHRHRASPCSSTLGLGLFPGPVLDWLTVPIPLLS